MAKNTRKISRTPARKESDPSTSLTTTSKGLEKYLNSSKLGSLSRTIDSIELDRDKVMLAIESFINSRPKTPEYLKLSRMLHYYAELNAHEKIHTSYEELCEMFSVDYPLLIATVTGGLYEQNLSLSKIEFAKGMPDVARAVIQRASSAKGGTQDAKLALQVTGMLQEAPQVQVLNNNQITQNNSNVSITPPPNFKSEILSLDDMIRETYDRARKSDADAEIIEE